MRHLDEKKIDELLQELAHKKAENFDINTLFVRATSNLPKRSKESFFERFFKVALMPAAATILLLFGMFLALILIQDYHPYKPQNQPQTCEIERIESHNSTAIIANGTGAEPTVIWIFEE